MNHLKNNILKSAAILPLAACLAAATAVAQDAPATDDTQVQETVTVTGSRIKRTDLTSVGPVTVELNRKRLRLPVPLARH